MGRGVLLVRMTYIKLTFKFILNFHLVTESPMSISFLANNEMPKFKLANINDATYWRHVKRMVARELNFKKVDGTVMHSISRTFERNGGIHAKLPSPFYDALCLVLRKPRQGFQHEAFFAKYPSVVEMVDSMRRKIMAAIV